jgi:predicted XRE-type DNA-binding protein
MAYPTKSKIKKALGKLEKAEGSLALSSNPSALEKFRFELQQRFLTFKQRKDITQRELAELLGIDEPKVSKLLHNRIDEFSTDRLISLYAKLEPKLRIELKVS